MNLFAKSYVATYAMTSAQLGALKPTGNCKCLFFVFQTMTKSNLEKQITVCAAIDTGRTTFFGGAACGGLAPSCVDSMPSFAGFTYELNAIDRLQFLICGR